VRTRVLLLYIFWVFLLRPGLCDRSNQELRYIIERCYICACLGFEFQLGVVLLTVKTEPWTRGPCIRTVNLQLFNGYYRYYRVSVGWLLPV